MSGQRERVRRRQRIFRWAVITVVTTFFALPLLGMLDFTTRGPGGVRRSAETWRSLSDFGTVATDYPTLTDGLVSRWAWPC